MAPYVCDNGDGTLAAIVITIIQTGDVMALCGPCSGPWALGYAAAAAEAQGLTMSEVLDALRSTVEAQTAVPGQPSGETDGATDDLGDVDYDLPDIGPGAPTDAAVEPGGGGQGGSTAPLLEPDVGPMDLRPPSR